MSVSTGQSAPMAEKSRDSFMKKRTPFRFAVPVYGFAQKNVPPGWEGRFSYSDNPGESGLQEKGAGPSPMASMVRTAGNQYPGFSTLV